MATRIWQPVCDEGNLLFKFIRDLSEVLADGIDGNWINIEKKSMYPRMSNSKKRGEKALKELIDEICKRIGQKYMDLDDSPSPPGFNVPYDLEAQTLINDTDMRVLIKTYKEHPLLCHDYEIITSASSNEWSNLFQSWPLHCAEVKGDCMTIGMTDWVKQKLNLTTVMNEAHKDSFETIKTLIKTEDLSKAHLLGLMQYVLDLYIKKANIE